VTKSIAGALIFVLSFAAVPASRAPAAAAPVEDGRILVMLRWAPSAAAADREGSADATAGRAERLHAASQLASDHGLALGSSWVMVSLQVDCFLMTVPREQSPAEVIKALAHEPRVAWAQPVHAFHTLGHNDPLFRLQPAATEWHLAELHALTTGQGVSIAQADSGVELTHPDLDGQVSLAKNFVDGSDYAAEEHGTAVAGVIVARADNGVGIVGVAPGARLMALRACEQAGTAEASCDSFSLAKSLQFALNQHADVINLSLTGPDDELLGRLLDAALRQGVTVVAAADARAEAGGFPASHPGAIAVVQEGENGAFVGVAAPGQEVPTTLPGGRWGLASGSSIAAAHVSGMVALIRQLAPSLRPEQVRAVLGAATGTGRAGVAAASGERGRIDACAAITRVSGTCACQCARR